MVGWNAGMICNCDEPEGEERMLGDTVAWKHDHLNCGTCIPLFECSDCRLALSEDKIYRHYLNTNHNGEYVATVQGFAALEPNGVLHMKPRRQLVILGRDGRLQLCPECGKPMFIKYGLTETVTHSCGNRIMILDSGLSVLSRTARVIVRQHPQPLQGKQTGR